MKRSRTEGRERERRKRGRKKQKKKRQRTSSALPRKLKAASKFPAPARDLASTEYLSESRVRQRADARNPRSAASKRWKSWNRALAGEEEEWVEEVCSSSEDEDDDEEDASRASDAGSDAAVEVAVSRVPEPSCRSSAQ